MIRALRQTLPRASILAMIDSHLRRKLSDPENCLVAAQAMVDSMEVRRFPWSNPECTYLSSHSVSLSPAPS